MSCFVVCICCIMFKQDKNIYIYSFKHLTCFGSDNISKSTGKGLGSRPGGLSTAEIFYSVPGAGIVCFPFS